MTSYAELHCLTNFSFLRAASHPGELVEQASALGYAAMAVTDRHSLAGVVRGHAAAKQFGIQPMPFRQCCLRPTERPTDD
jgi:error-prone DNA polymerase